jgi:orotate phosphoribosyltransferase
MGRGSKEARQAEEACAEILRRYRRADALLDGHFALRGGWHSRYFLQSLRVLQHPRHRRWLAKLLVADFIVNVQTEAPDFVVGPAMGGAVLAQAVGDVFGVPSLFAEKVRDVDLLAVRDAFGSLEGKRYLAVEDVVTTGTSLQRCIDAVSRKGAQCVAGIALIDRSETGAQLYGLPLRALCCHPLPAWTPDHCPLCQAGSVLEHV